MLLELSVEPAPQLLSHWTCALFTKRQVFGGADDALLLGEVLDAVELEDEVEGLLRDRCCRQRLVEVAA